MFWGLILKASKKYSQTVTKAFHLSQAALDQSTCGDDDIQVMLTAEEHTYLLCTLRKNKLPQVALDLNFAEGDKISLSTTGNGTVHLTGFLVPDMEDFNMGEEEDESAEEDDEVPSGKPERIAKKVAAKLNAKEVHLEEHSEDDADETFEMPKDAPAVSEDDSDEDDDEDDAANGDGQDEDDSDEDDDDEDDDDEAEDDDDDSDSEEEEPKAKVAKIDKKSKQNGLENGKASSKEKKEVKEPASKVKTLQGGLVIEELKVGIGKEATNGKKVQVYYEGRLKKNNKVFDSSKSGPGFKFGLGRGEVIRGWDIGVAGMKIGGKRRITCPPALAYGNKGSPPVIPPNSTLVFDVELKNVF